MPADPVGTDTHPGGVTGFSPRGYTYSVRIRPVFRYMSERWIGTRPFTGYMGVHAESKPAERTSTRVIEAIADARGVEPTELDVPLYWEIDLEALDQLCDTGDVAVTFTYDGTIVTVDGDDHIEVGETVYEA